MSLSDIVNVQILTSGPGVTRQGYGVPLLVSYHTRFPERIRTYSSIRAMETDGFLATDDAHKKATAIFAQNPHCPKIKVGRRASAFTQTIDLTPEAPSSGKVYAITINGAVATYTAGGGDNLAAVCTALATAIAALPLVGATGASGTKVVVTADATGIVHKFESPVAVSLFDATTDPGIAADLSAIEAVDKDFWAILLDSNGKAELVAAAAWTETRTKLLIGQTSDTGVGEAGTTTDVASTLKTSASFRTAIFVHPVLGTAFAAGLAGKVLSADAGSEVWVHHQVAGVAGYTPTDSQVTAYKAKNVTWIEDTLGLYTTRGGHVAAGEWIDIIRARDWLKSEMEADIVQMLLDASSRNKKIPYTNAGIQSVKDVVDGTLKTAVANDVLSADPAPVVTAPKASEVSAQNRTDRLLPSVGFSAQFAGAIIAVNMEGVVYQ